MQKWGRIALLLAGLVLLFTPVYWLFSTLTEVPYAPVLNSFMINVHGGRQIGYTVSIISFVSGYLAIQAAIKR